MTKQTFNYAATSLLVEVARLAREEFRRRASHVNLTQPQWRVLLCLSREPGANVARLAQMLEVHQVTVTQSVDRLEKAGWVSRARSERDRRAVRLSLTKQAEPIMEELGRIAEETREVVLSGFDPRERADLEAMLQRVKDNLCLSQATPPGEEP